MRKFKTFCLLCLVITVCISLQGCKSPFLTYRYPGGQYNSVWSTEDNSIVFHIGNSLADPIYGTIETEDGPEEIVISMSDYVLTVAFYHKEDGITSGSDFAHGYGKVISRKEYQIEIDSADAYFESGQVLTFYRTVKGNGYPAWPGL